MAELPYGIDRADGLAGRLGTPTPVDAIKVQVDGGLDGTIEDLPIEETPDSPSIERAEQCTVTHTFTMSWSEAMTRINYWGMGRIYQDSTGNYYLILSSHVQRQPGGYARVTLVTESKSFDTPPDSFSLVPVELGLNIMKHPRYFYAFFGDGYGSLTEKQNQMVMRLLQDYFENVTAAHRNAITNLLNGSMNSDAGEGAQPPEYKGVPWDTSLVKIAGTNMAKRAALEIIQKYWRGEETPYIVGWQITWTQYFFRPPAINPGGYVEDPLSEAVPQLPAYFYSTEFPPDSSKTIFDDIVAINPQCYSDDGTFLGNLNISWLRKADDIEFQRTWFRLTRTWIGSPVGFWDTELYTNGPRPQNPGDYLEIG